MRSYLSLFHVLIFFLLCSKVYCYHHVAIIRNLSDNSGPLNVRCQSKDDDLGVHTLTHRGESFSWKFRPSPIDLQTLYFCHFYWNAKDISFDVFNAKTLPNANLIWDVRDDGFYLASENIPIDPSGWTKLHDWPV